MNARWIGLAGVALMLLWIFRASLPNIGAAPADAADLPGWSIANSELMMFSLDETWSYSVNGAPRETPGKWHRFVLGTDCSGQLPANSMAELRYRDFTSPLLLWCSQILTHPENFREQKGKVRGGLRFGQIRGEASWTYQRLPEREGGWRVTGEIADYLHPLAKTGSLGTVQWALEYDDENEMWDAFSYTLQMEVENYLWRPTAAAPSEMLQGRIGITGKATMLRVPGASPVPQPAIDQGIAMGSAMLMEQLPRYSRLTYQEVEQDLYRKYEEPSPGRLLLMLLALGARSDVSAHPEWLDMLARTDAMDFKKAETYTVALYLMAYHELRRTAGAALTDNLRQRLDRHGRICAKKLLDDFVPRKGWGYPLNPFNLSTTQYALLGIYAASEDGLCDPKSPQFAGVLRDAAEVYFKQQQPRGKKVHLQYGPWKTQPGEVTALGWSYNDAYASAPYGSMTAAGIGSQAIILLLLRKAGKLPKDLSDRLTDSIHGGIGWMQLHYDVEVSQSDGELPPGFSVPLYYHYYYLYGLEKAATLCDLPGFATSSWYRDCAAHLLTHQMPSGRWDNGHELAGPDVATAFALLVLKNASRGIVTDLMPDGASPVTSGK